MPQTDPGWERDGSKGFVGSGEDERQEFDTHFRL